MNKDEQELDKWWVETFFGLVNEAKYEELIETCFTEDALVLPPGLDPISGRIDILIWFTELFESLKGLRVHTERQSAECTIVGDMAIHVEIGHFVGRSGDGELHIFSMPRKYMHIFKRVDGAWKLHRYIWNESPREET